MMVIRLTTYAESHLCGRRDGGWAVDGCETRFLIYFGCLYIEAVLQLLFMPGEAEYEGRRVRMGKR